MDTLTNWTAQRSGGRITISGADRTGRPTKIANVDRIVADAEGPIATDKNGERYRLLCPAA